MNPTKYLTLVVAAGLCLGMNCQGEMPAAQEPPVTCRTSFFDAATGVGLSPPPVYGSPTIIGSGTSFITYGWFLGDDDAADIILDVEQITDPQPTTFEDRVSALAQSDSLTFVENSGPVVFDSGQEGWIITRRFRAVPADLIKVTALLARGNRFLTVFIVGSSFDGTNDFSLLIDIASSLCAE